MENNSKKPLNPKRKSSHNNKSNASENIPLANPKPQRFLLDRFSYVTESLKTTPSPSFRKSSPHLSSNHVNHKLSENELLDERSSISSVPGKVFNREVQNISPIAEYSASPFLGEQLSVQEGAFGIDNKKLSDMGGKDKLGMTRSQSLEALSTAISTSPCMIRMPQRQDFRELGDCIENIPQNAWILPYIIASSPTFILQKLLDLPKLCPLYDKSSSDNLASWGNNILNNSTLDGSRRRGFSYTPEYSQLRAKMSPYESSIYSLNIKSNNKRNVYLSKTFNGQNMDDLNGKNDSADDSHLKFLDKKLIHVGPPKVPLLAHDESSADFQSLKSNVPITWRSLGHVLLCKDPSWRPWESKIVLLLDNYLLEYTADGSSIIGYSQLSGARITKSFLQKKQYYNLYTSSLKSNAEYQEKIKSIPNYGLVITCFANSKYKTSPQIRYWLTTQNETQLDYIASALVKASMLTVEDVFDIPDNSDKSSLLGRGRFNEVRHARRKSRRPLFDYEVFKKLNYMSTLNQMRNRTRTRSNNSNSDVEKSESGASEPAMATLDTSSHGISISNHNSSASGLNNYGQINGNGTGSVSSNSTSMNNNASSPMVVENRPRSDSKEFFDIFEYSNTRSFSKDPINSPPNALSPKSTSPTSFDQNSQFQLSPSSTNDGLFKEPTDDQEIRYNISSNSLAHSISGGNLVHSQSGGNLPSELMFENCDFFSDEEVPEEGTFCALKLVSKEIFWERVGTGKERGDSLVREVLAQLLLSSVAQNHPSKHSLRDHHHHLYLDAASHQSFFPIVKLFSAFETINGFAIELELMQQQDLFDRLAEKGVMKESQVRFIAYQLVEAISHCNKLGIAHRDIKLSNITFPLPENMTPLFPDSNTDPAIQEVLNDFIEIKLADFGMAGFVSSDKKLRGRCGTPGYVAPDILKAGYNESYGLNVDIFSIGVVVYTLLCGYEPFYGADNQELLNTNKNVEYEFHSPEWDNISIQAKDWISQALQAECSLRLTPEQAKKHPWLSDIYYMHMSHIDALYSSSNESSPRDFISTPRGQARHRSTGRSSQESGKRNKSVDHFSSAGYAFKSYNDLSSLAKPNYSDCTIS